jgi:A/G-specific adenine glycosylase
LAGGGNTMAENKIKDFKKIVWAHYKKFGRRDLPWRKTKNPYRILVSEIMLQQTQVERVIPFYKKFVKEFPTAKKLSAAPLSEVLKSWQGLGYNRRAKMLHEAAKQLSAQKTFSIAELEKLPGVGAYTARAIAAFAFNQEVIFVETNIRTAVLHHFFANKKKISDKEIEKILTQVLPKGKSREWYSALMDYGAYLKKSGIKLNAKHQNYAKQKKFSGSNREARGAILRELAASSRTQAQLLYLFDSSRHSQLRSALTALEKEGLIQKKGRRYALPA